MNSSVSAPSGTRSVITFFALAFGISWAVWIPAALASYDKIAFRMNKDLSSLLGVFGPFIAAVITAAIYDRATGLGISRAFRELFISYDLPERYLLQCIEHATLKRGHVQLNWNGEPLQSSLRIRDQFVGEVRQEAIVLLRAGKVFQYLFKLIR